MQETVKLADGSIVEVADFEWGFALNGKAEATEQDDGSFIIEGFASDFDVDRQDEAFEPNAFEAGLKAYMANPVLLYHHKADTALGKIIEADVLPGKGLYVKALVDAPEPGTQTADYVRKIKNGTIKGFSVGGKFYRHMTAAGQRIFKCDLREISVTPLPVNQRMLFAVAGKAFNNVEDPTMDTPDTKAIEEALARLDAAFTRAEQSLEGKASGHPDGPAVAALQYHLQQIHTLATNKKQDMESDDGKNLASSVADTAEAHLKKLHEVAKKVGPLPNYQDNMYGSTRL